MSVFIRRFLVLVTLFFAFSLFSCFGSSSGDEGGDGGSSSPAGSSVIPDTVAPYVVSSTPSHDSNTVGVNSDITIVFSESLDSNTISTDTVQVVVDGGTILGSRTLSASTLTFTPLFALSPGKSYTVVVKKEVTDLAGNPMSEDHSFVFSTASNVSPEINIKRDTTNLPSGSGLHNYGTVVVSQESSVVLTIENLGSAPLSIHSINLSGTHSAMYSVDSSSVPSSIAAGESASCTVIFRPTSTGVKNASLVITSNDSDEGTYTISLRGTGVVAPSPEINVKNGLFNLPSGSQGHDYGNVIVNQTGATVTFTIENTGTGALSISGIAVTGSGSSQFVLDATTVASSVSPGASTTFTVTFAPTSAGSKSAVISIENNDSDENPFVFSVVGTASPASSPELNIAKPGGYVMNGGIYDYQEVNTISSSTETFTVQNLGTADLHLTGSPVVTVSGNNESDFEILSYPASTIAPGGSSSFTIRFKPGFLGLRRSTVSIPNNDDDEGSFSFQIRGTGKPRLSTVDSVGDVGVGSSIATDSTGASHICYNDSSNKDLKYATNSSGTWQFTTLDSDGDIYAGSIAVDASDRVHISYYDSTNQDLKYATNKTGSWQCMVVDSVGSVGTNSSIAVSADGVVHISYYDSTGVNLKYASIANGSVFSEIIDDGSGLGVGTHTSLALDSNGACHISYYDMVNRDLKYANNASGSWVISVVSSVDSSGEFNTLAVDSNGKIHIAFFYQGYAEVYVRYANNISGSWSITNIEGTNVNFLPRISLDLDSSNRAHIAYRNSIGRLGYATNATGSFLIFNIDNGFQVGTYSSLSIGPDGRVNISYYDSNNDDLKYARF